MIAGGPAGVWKVLALADLSRGDAGDVVENALAIAARLRGEVTLLSVVPRRLYERGVRDDWPACAFGRRDPGIDIHRVVLPGPAAEALSVYADQIRSDVVVIPGDCTVGRWPLKRPLAPFVAALTSRMLWIVPAGAGAWSASTPRRLACVLRLDGTDDVPCTTARSVAHRFGGEVVLLYPAKCRLSDRNGATTIGNANAALDAVERLGRSLDVPWSACMIEDCSHATLNAAITNRRVGLIVAGRPMYINCRDQSGTPLSLAYRLVCPVLSVPFSVSTATRR